MAMTSERALVHGRYEVEPLRDGIQSSVHEGVDRHTGRPVILKAVPASDFERASTLVHERETLLRLDHPGLPRCVELFEEGGQVWLVLERVPGVDLERTLAMGDVVVDEPQLRRWAVQLAEILVYLHGRTPPVIYRDLKPSNIVRTPDDRLVLVDFGAARVKTAAAKDTVALGTPGYAPPEQYPQGGGTTDERADVYALGVTLFELLTGRDPASFHFDFPPARSLGVKVSPQLEAILQRMLDPDPAKRHASAAALLRDLRGKPSAQPLVMPIVVVAGAGLLAGAAALDTTSWLPRYLAAAAAIAVAAVTARPRGSRGVTSVLFVAVLALAGALPLAVPLTVANSLMRRVPLELGGTTAPLEAAGVGWAVLGAWMAAAGWLVGRAMRGGRGWLALAAFAAFTLALTGAVVGRMAERDDAAPEVVAASPVWRTPLQDVGDGLHLMLLRSHPRLTERDRPRSLRWERAEPDSHLGDRSFIVVRHGDTSFEVLDGVSGRSLWSGKAALHRPVMPDGDVLHQVLGRQVITRAAEDGAVRATLTAPREILDVQPGPRSLVLSLDDGSLLAADKHDLHTLWTWKGPSPLTHIMNGGEDVVLGFARGTSRLYALGASDGRLLWERDIVFNRGFRSLRAGHRLLMLTADGVEGLDPANGKTAFRFTLPVGEVGPDQWEAVRVSSIGEDLLVVQRNEWLFQIRVPDGALVWRTRLPGEDIELRECGPGMLYLMTRSGKLLGLESRSGRVTWERWSGGLGEHVWPARRDGFAFLETVGPMLLFQERLGDDLRVLDPQTGRLVGRWQLDDSARVRRVVDEGGMWYVLVERDGACAIEAIRRVRETSGVVSQH